MEPLVSAVIVTHNRRQLLEEAVQSVLRQTWPNIQLTVVDDGSTDGTRAWMETFAPTHGIDYVYNDEGLGGNHARNIGIRRSRGSYVALLDDDDAWLPDKTAKQVAYLETHPEAGAVSCGKISIYDFSRREPEDPALLPEGDLSRAIFTDLHFTTSRLMFRREALEAAGLFDESLKAWQDYELMIRLCQQTRVGIVRENLLLYNIVTADPQRITNRTGDWEAAVKRIHDKHAALIAALPEETRRQHRLMVCRDGASRAERAGDPAMKRAYLWRTWRLNPTAQNLKKWALNKRELPPSLARRLRAALGRRIRRWTASH